MSIKIQDKGIITFQRGGTYDMINDHPSNIQGAKLMILREYVNDLIEHHCETSELKDDFKSAELMKIAEDLYDLRFKDTIEHYSLYKVEFKADDYSIPKLLLEAPWTDSSWHNDSCPSFLSYPHRLRVWVDCDRRHKREDASCSRIGVARVCEEGEWEEDLFFCEDEAELIKFLTAYETEHEVMTFEKWQAGKVVLTTIEDIIAKAKESGYDEDLTEEHARNITYEVYPGDSIMECGYDNEYYLRIANMEYSCSVDDAVKHREMELELYQYHYLNNH